jgi:hypothetical protein
LIVHTVTNSFSNYFNSLPCLSETYLYTRKGRKSELRRRIWIQTTATRS